MARYEIPFDKNDSNLPPDDFAADQHRWLPMNYRMIWMERCERHFTAYLLSRAVDDIREEGYLKFYNLKCFSRSTKPVVKLGLHAMSIANSKGEYIEFPYSQIKKVSFKNHRLYFEHENFQRHFLLPNTGNRAGIPIEGLGNLAFFEEMLRIFTTKVTIE